MLLLKLPSPGSVPDVSEIYVGLFAQLIIMLGAACVVGLLFGFLCLLMLWAEECRDSAAKAGDDSSMLPENVWAGLLGVGAFTLALFSGVSFGQQVDRAELLFQQALHEEVANGSLERAIELYRQVVEMENGNRSVAARALIHIGSCYEKLGKTEARKAYEQVIRDYADQPDSAQIARRRLAVLVKVADTRQPSLSVRMIWSDPTTDVEGSPSPDGRLLTFVDWSTGDLAIRDLETGENRRLTNKGSWQDSEDYALFSCWSPDGQTIAFDWYENEGMISGIRLIRPDGSGLKTVFRSPDEESWVGMTGWSPDGAEVLVFGANKQDAYIGAIRLTDGRLRVIRDLRRPFHWPAEFSPDGKYILFSETSQDGNTDILIVSSDGKQSFRLVDHPAYDRSLGWHPNGKWVLFVSDRTGSMDLWAVQMQDGRPRAEPVKISPSVPAEVSLGFTQKGELFFGASHRSTDIYVVDKKPDEPGARPSATRLVQRFEGRNSWPSYSPDGKKLAYVSARGAVAKMGKKYNTLCVLDLQTGKTSEFPLEFDQLYNPLWLPGKDILVFAASVIGDRMDLCEFDLKTMQTDCPKQWVYPDYLVSHQISPDGKTVFYSSANRDTDIAEIRRIDRESGEEKVLFQGASEEWPKLALSPDGSRLAFLSRRDERLIRVIPAEGGAIQELCGFEQTGNFVLEFAWSADGKYIVVPKTDLPPPPMPSWELWSIRVADCQSEKLLSTPGQASKITVHPGGRLMAFSAVDHDSNAEVWILADYLPEVEKGKSPDRKD